MNLFAKIRAKGKDRRLEMQAMEQGILDGILRFASGVTVTDGTGSARVCLVKGAQLQGRCEVKAPYYLQFLSDGSEQGCLSAGYAAGQTAAYLRLRGIGAAVCRNFHEWPVRMDQGELQCSALLAFGQKREEGRNRGGNQPERYSCIRVGSGEKWSEEVLAFAGKRELLGAQYTRVICRGEQMHFMKKASARKHPQQAAVDAGLLMSDVMTAAEELWIDLEIVKQKGIKEEGYWYSIRQRKGQDGPVSPRPIEVLDADVEEGGRCEPMAVLVPGTEVSALDAVAIRYA